MNDVKLLDGGEGDDDVAAHCRVVLFLKTEGSRFTDVGDRENPFGDTQEARFLQQIKENTPFSDNTRAGWGVIQHLAFQFITFTADHNCNA